MTLALIVSLIVLGALAIVGTAIYLIDRSVKCREQEEQTRSS